MSPPGKTPPGKPKSAGGPEGPKTSWSVNGVVGVVPPGRRLGEGGEKRRAIWSASGVAGIVPPGNTAPGEGPAARWAIAKSKGESPTKLPALKGKRGQSPSLAPERPTAGFVPDLRAGGDDPKDLKAFLDLFAEAHGKIAIDAESAAQLAQLVGQSHAPFEILVAFTWLSAWVGADGQRRKEHQWALERGAKVFFNLAKRLDPTVRPPRGLVPKTVDPLFFDLPPTAFQLPYAYAVDAFLRLLELMRGDHVRNKKLIELAHQLYERFIEKRSFGDRGLSAMFPWKPPAWAPEASAPSPHKK